MPQPTLIVVSGPAGSGKTTLAYQVSRLLGCPAICRDEIKEGMVHATPGFTPHPGDPLTQRTLGTFFDVLQILLGDGVTVIAEAAFQDHVWRPRLEPLRELASLRIINCVVEPAIARARIAHRARTDPRRAAHTDQRLLLAMADGQQPTNIFIPIAMAAPTLQVDTTDGYEPGLPAIVDFINTP